jgi:hypothetical protein
LPDFSAPQIYTPMGGLPPGVSGIVTQGPDVALIGSVPLIVALILGAVPTPVLLLQVVLTFGAVTVASWVRQRPTSPATTATGVPGSATPG